MESFILWRISKEQLTSLFNRYHEIERLVRIAYEKYYIRLEERYVNAQFKTAASCMKSGCNKLRTFLKEYRWDISLHILE